MPLKELNVGVPGTATRVGPDDWDLLTKTLNGKPNTTPLAMKNNFTFYHGFCKFINEANGKVVSIGTNFNTQTLTYYLPEPIGVNDDTLVTNEARATLTNKTIDLANNTVYGVDSLPSNMKTGVVVCGWATGGNTGQGLLSGFVDSPAVPSHHTDFTHGTYWRYAAGGTANTAAGIRMPGAFATKELLCRMRTKTRVVSTANTSRQYVGFSSNPTLAADNSPLPSNTSGVLVGWRDSDSNITVFTNSGTSGATSTFSPNATNQPRAAGVRTFDVIFERDTATNNIIARVRVFDNTNTQIINQTFSSNLPPANTLLSPSIHYSNTTANTNYDVFLWEMLMK